MPVLAASIPKGTKDGSAWKHFSIEVSDEEGSTTKDPEVFITQENAIKKMMDGLADGSKQVSHLCHTSRCINFVSG